MPSRRRCKILIAARHPSAAGGAASIARAARRRRIGVECFATGPAWVSLLARGIPDVYCFATADARYVGLPRYRGPARIENEDLNRPTVVRRQVDAMVAWLTAYLLASRPSVIVLTDATEQLGADQLLAVAATRLGIPTIRVRDSWGTAVGVETRAMRGLLPEPLRRQGLATRYLEIDPRGIELSVRRLGLPRNRLHSVGGLYTLDRLVGRATASRHLKARQAIGVAPGVPLVTYFTQPTRRERAEVMALDAFVAGMNRAGLAAKGVVLATQEHPREADPADGELGLNWTAKRAAAAYQGAVINLSPKVLLQRTVSFEDTMAASDVFASSYSNASIEATALGASAVKSLPIRRRPVGFHSLCPGAVRSTMALSRAGLRLTPFGESGAVAMATAPSQIGTLLSQLLLRPSSRRAHFRAMGRNGIGRCADRIIDEAIGLVGDA